ncbi:MAG: hypothetical protein ABJF23_14340 [Bryobacteraceae bacterium]
MKRRSFFGGIASAGLLPAAIREKPKLGLHRNLFTGDSCVYFYNPELFQPEGLPYTAKALHRYVDLLADNGVDTFLSNPNASVAWYPSKKLQTVIDGYKRGDRNFFRGHAEATHVPPEQLDEFLDHMVNFFNLYLDLADAGVDWLAETTKACRRRKISPWVSIRMNDTHGVENPEGSHFNCALVKKKEFRLSGVLPDPSAGTNAHWMALNYDKQEVRDFTFSHIRESVQDYDFEGLELDWLRDPHCCEPGATQAQADKITGWIGEVRALTEAQGRKMGKPYPMGMRIPGNLGYLRSRGLDVKAIVKAGYVDFLGFSNHWQTTWDMPYDELRRELGPDVAFYGVVEDAPNWIPGYSPKLASQGTRYMASSPPMQHANAAGKLAMGVHGIEQFNFFCTDQPKTPGLRADYTALRGTHDLAFLRGKPKHYCLSTPSGRASAAWELPEQLPAVIDSKGRRQFRLSMCTEPAGMKLVAQVVVEKPLGDVRLGVSVNGRWPVFESRRTQEMLYPVGPYTQHIPENAAYNFVVNAADLKDGWNTFTVSNSAAAVKAVSLEIGVFA